MRKKKLVVNDGWYELQTEIPDYFPNYEILGVLISPDGVYKDPDGWLNLNKFGFVL